MTNQQKTSDQVWEDIHNKCEEIHIKIVEKKKLQPKKVKKATMAVESK